MKNQHHSETFNRPSFKVRTMASWMILTLLFGCAKEQKPTDSGASIDSLATQYVKLGLKIGQYDADFVDAFYGPDTLKPAKDNQSVLPKDSLLGAVSRLKSRLEKLRASDANDSVSFRASWISKQLTGFERRIRIFSGEKAGFDAESKDLFDAVAPVFPEEHFKSLIRQLDGILPGTGKLDARFQLLAQNFLLPENKIDTVFRTAIAESRKRTLEHYSLPATETFTLQYVRDKPWSGYNWYQGKYKSIIQINVSQPIFIERAIDLACHEGYPGHHVFNVMLEKNLYRDRGWTEISLYPLFSPQSLIAEGSANYGIDVAFPGSDQQKFCREILMPLAGIDTTNCGRYFKALALKSQLNYARNEVGRGIVNAKMTDLEGIRWLSEYCLLTPKGAADYIKFIKKYRSYVINYNYGQDLVKKYIESRTSGQDVRKQRWALFQTLLRNEFTASDLLK